LNKDEDKTARAGARAVFYSTYGNDGECGILNAMIQNLKDIACTPLRKDALAILEAGYMAIDTKVAMKKSMTREGDVFSINNTTCDLSRYRHVYVVAFGKCAAAASEVVEEVVGDVITDGVVIDVRSGAALSRLQYHEGSHPFPSEKNVAATRNIETMLERATKDDLVIVIVSGGGSSLLCDPHDMTCSTLTDITQAHIACPRWAARCAGTSGNGGVVCVF
jgi:glycerate-2-kinase